MAQEAAFDFANMLWRVLVIDVEATLKRAMHKVLNDHAVSDEARVRRARALRVLGNVFRSTCFAPRTTEIEVAAGIIFECELRVIHGENSYKAKKSKRLEIKRV